MVVDEKTLQVLWGSPVSYVHDAGYCDFKYPRQSEGSRKKYSPCADIHQDVLT